MNSDSNAQESENTMCNILKSAQHVLAMNAFANESKTIKYLSNPNTEAEAMRIEFEYLKQNKCVAFVVTSSNIARALVEK
ncbi:1925_t:CDS:2, partial [Cetraspora pellucida]